MQGIFQAYPKRIRDEYGGRIEIPLGFVNQISKQCHIHTPNKVCQRNSKEVSTR